MLPEKIVFVDIETTGLRPSFDRIIEIGIVRIEGNTIVQTYHSLINPETYLPKEITQITGITADDLENAPTFRQIKNDILESMIDAVFVAHNVRFDYGFLRQEFKRENITFSSRHFCTVRLSRLIYPTLPRHNLETIINTFNLPYTMRHRALDDAQVLYHLYQKMQTEIPQEQLAQAINKSLKQPSLPLNLTHLQLETLPELPGVYLFYGEDEIPLYIGKSKNIKERVLSHFSADIHSPTEMKISQQIKSIETITTAGELGALLLESHLIKKHLPLYNKKSRIKHELVALKQKINAHGYHECFIEPITTIAPEDLENILGIFKSKKQAKAFLADLAKNYLLCEKLLGLEKTNAACFAYRLKRCNGACVQKENVVLYNMRFLTAFAQTKIQSWPFSGPIIIEEAGMGGEKEYFLVDKWCYIANIVIDEEGNKKMSDGTQPVFDLDIYHIIKQYIKNPHHLKKIKTISSTEIPLF